MCVELLIYWWLQQVFFGDGFSYERSIIEEYVRQTMPPSPQRPHQIGSDPGHPITIKIQVPSPRYNQTYARRICTLAGMVARPRAFIQTDGSMRSDLCDTRMRACMLACRYLWCFSHAGPFFLSATQDRGKGVCHHASKSQLETSDRIVASDQSINVNLRATVSTPGGLQCQGAHLLI